MKDTYNNTSETTKEFLKQNELRDKSKFYSVGDIFNFTLEDEKYLLTSFWGNKCCLISMKTGKYFVKAVDVADKHKTTENDWRQITASYGHHFKKI